MATDTAPPEGLDDYVASLSPGKDSAPVAQQQAPSTPAPEGLDDYVAGVAKDEHEHALQSRYGGLKQQGIAALEGAGKGLLGPVASGLELAAGVQPEDIRGRAEANPITHGVAEAGTFLGSALAGTGEAAVLGEAGKALGAATGLEKAAQGGRLARAGTEAAKQAFEGILYQGGEELHKSFIKDPAQTSDNIVTNMGITGVLSGLFGGAVGAALGKAAKPAAEELGSFVSELDRPAIEAGELAANFKAADNVKPGLKEKVLDAIKLNKQKANAGEIKSAAAELGAPVLDGMTLESPLVQTQLDALIHSRYTVAGSRVGGKFDEAYKAAADTLDNAITAGPAGSKADLGNALKAGLTEKTRNEYAPIKAVYDELAATHELVPIEADAATTLRSDLGEIPEFRVSPSSPQGQLVKQVLKDIDNVKTVSDLKILKDGLSLPATASSQERRMVGILRDKLGDIEEDALHKYAKGFARNDEAGAYVQSLLDAKKEVTPKYKAYINDLSTLSEGLGKGKIHGTEDALRFINEGLDPEQVASRIFKKGSSEFNDFIAKKYPEEFLAVRNFQRADMIEKATRGDQGFNAKAFFTNFNKLEPEVQQKLYSPGEIKKIKAAETYIREAFPKNFNPSGTSHMAALREAYESPKGFAVANVRDYAIEKAIQAAHGSSEGSQAVTLAQAAVKGENAALKAVKSIFNASKEMPSNVIPFAASRSKLDKLVSKTIADPTRLISMNDNNNSVPELNGPLAASAGRVVQYLAAIKPKTDPAHPLDPKRVPSSYEKSQYDRALDIAEQPLTVLHSLKEGRITPFDMISLKSMYPNLYNKLATKIQEQIIDVADKGKSIPYTTRMGLAIFLGQPLDSTMTPASIISAQPVPSQQPPQAPASGGMATGNQSKGLQKLPGAYQTPEQARAARNQRP